MKKKDREDNSRADRNIQPEQNCHTMDSGLAGKSSQPDKSIQSDKSSGVTKNRRFRVHRTILLALLGILIGVNVYLWNAENLLGNRLPMPFGYGAAVVLSGSMEPELSVGDLVIVRKTKDVAVDDVIVYENGSELIIHRVIAVDGDEILTQGDANTVADAPITADSVKGVLVIAIPGAGKLVQLLRQPWMVALIIVAAFVLMELSNRREKARDREELSQLEAEISALARELTGDASTEDLIGGASTEDLIGGASTEDLIGGVLTEDLIEGTLTEELSGDTPSEELTGGARDEEKDEKK